ncbi:small multidrug resistance pump [Tamaricihabitans halophyticus]|uniref:Small multidrug resistance pump n=1 Tax=Tamaricihabitans halophyticus TaxID=1262583 RepID=A0A4R2QJX6_9PSEU|nr:SMR family transporter [Tamaricihabitans halophyticus]TCP47351.1 small multidrug resistance pump [Tamaricihabitans halophyticus]
MSVLLLAAAVGCGVSGTLLVKLSAGFRRWWPSVGSLIAYAGATVLLARLVEMLPVGVVYAVWTGIAAIVLLVVDRLFFGERLGWRHGVGVGLVVAGITLINFGGGL